MGLVKETLKVIPLEEIHTLERRQWAVSSSAPGFQLTTAKKHFSSTHETAGVSIPWPLQAHKD